jgi:hypothetical protein
MYSNYRKLFRNIYRLFSCMFILIVFFTIFFLGFSVFPARAKNFALIHQKTISSDGDTFLSSSEIDKWKAASNEFGFCWGVANSWTRKNLLKNNPGGIYVTHINIVNIDREMSLGGVAPPMDELNKHEDWFLHYKDGARATFFKNDRYRMDIGNKEYVDYIINWIKTTFPDTENMGIGIDSGMYYYADPRWIKYNTNKAWQDTWETFLKQLWTALHAKYKIILNVGGSDLSSFKRMMQFCDGCIVEYFSLKESRPLDVSETKAWMEKAIWCEKNGKICVLRDTYRDNEVPELVSYGYANFLMIKGKFTYYCINNHQNQAIYFEVMSVYTGGSESEFIEYYGDVLVREFDNIIVISNMSNKEKFMRLETNYKTLDGQLINSIKLHGKSGTILYRQGAIGTYGSSLSESTSFSPSNLRVIKTD